MKNVIKNKKMKAGIVATALIVLSAISFVATNTIAVEPTEEDVYIGPVTAYLNATDDYSGVDYTMHSISFTPPGGPTSQTNWIVYTEPLTVSARGDYIISYYSVDKEGNTEDTKTTSFSIFADVTAPVTLCTIQGEPK